jgi:hypothetical protein
MSNDEINSNPLKVALANLEEGKLDPDLNEEINEGDSTYIETNINSKPSSHGESTSNIPEKEKNRDKHSIFKNFLSISNSSKKEDGDTSTDEKINFDLDSEIEEADQKFSENNSDDSDVKKKKDPITLIKFVAIACIICLGIFLTLSKNPSQPDISSSAPAVDKKPVTDAKVDPIPLPPPIDGESIGISSNSENEKKLLQEVESIPLPSISGKSNSFKVGDITSGYENENKSLQEKEIISPSSTDLVKNDISPREENTPNISKKGNESNLFSLPVVEKEIIEEENTKSSDLEKNSETPKEKNYVTADELEKIKSDIKTLKKSLAAHTKKKKPKKVQPKITVLKIASASKNCDECIAHALITYNNKETFVGDGDHYKGYEVNIKGDRVVFINLKDRSSESYWMEK